MKIAIIGAGNLGLSIAKGLIVNNAFTTLYLTRRKTEDIADYEEYSKVTVTSDNRKAVQNSDILIFAVQPTQFERILEEIKDDLTEKHVLISTVTGFKIPRMESIVGEEQFIVRSMPNTAIAVGKSMTCLCSNEKGQKRIAIAEAIFNRLGTSIIIPENKMQAATVICASGIAFGCALFAPLRRGPYNLVLMPKTPTYFRCKPVWEQRVCSLNPANIPKRKSIR